MIVIWVAVCMYHKELNNKTENWILKQLEICINTYGTWEIAKVHLRPKIDINGCGKNMDEMIKKTYIIDDELTPILASVLSELWRFCIQLNAVNWSRNATLSTNKFLYVRKSNRCCFSGEVDSSLVTTSLMIVRPVCVSNSTFEITDILQL